MTVEAQPGDDNVEAVQVSVTIQVQIKGASVLKLSEEGAAVIEKKFTEHVTEFVEATISASGWCGPGAEPIVNVVTTVNSERSDEAVSGQTTEDHQGEQWEDIGEEEEYAVETQEEVTKAAVQETEVAERQADTSETVNGNDGSQELTARPPMKRALLIGINYIGAPNMLYGCINDARGMKDLITSLYDYKDENIRVLTDDQSENPTLLPTRQNIMQSMDWLLEGARENDSFFFYFSGHGASIVDQSGDEVDLLDEAICPMDQNEAGVILDDVLNVYLVQSVPIGCRLTAIVDCCHSGTIMDLPFIYSTAGKLQTHSILSAIAKGLFAAGLAYMKGDRENVYKSVTDIGSQLINTRYKEDKNRYKLSSKADVIMLGSCQDDQTSEDAFEENKRTGALSYSLAKILKKKKDPTLSDLLKELEATMHGRYTQIPQLSASHEIDLNETFVC